MPYVDAKVAAILCSGGPCKYVIRDGSGISDDWVLTHVVPNIAKVFHRGIAVVLGRALLYAAIENVDFICPRLKTLIQANYQHVKKGDKNPIKKVPIMVSGDEGQMFLDDLDEEEDDQHHHDNNHGGAGHRQADGAPMEEEGQQQDQGSRRTEREAPAKRRRGHHDQKLFFALNGKLNRVGRDMMEVQNQIVHLQSIMNSKYSLMHRSLHRIARTQANFRPMISRRRRGKFVLCFLFIFSYSNLHFECYLYRHYR